MDVPFKRIFWLVCFLMISTLLAQESTTVEKILDPAQILEGTAYTETSSETVAKEMHPAQASKVFEAETRGPEELFHEKSTAKVSDLVSDRLPNNEETKEKVLEQSESTAADGKSKPDTKQTDTSSLDASVQTGPFIDLLGPTLLSLAIVNESNAELRPHYTNEVLSGKKVVGLYFSADWCGPCRKFTPELVTFYDKINKRRGKKDEFEIVWISRCRDVRSFGQYFTQMGGWYALPPEEAMGGRGAKLSERYQVKGIPTLVLLDDVGNVITTDARNKIPHDKAGIGFPWRNPLATLYITILPKGIRVMINTQIVLFRNNLLRKAKLVLGLKKPRKV